MSLLSPEIMQLWLEMSQRGIHAFPHFFLYHRAPRIAVFYPLAAGGYTPVLDTAVRMFAAEVSAGGGAGVAYLLTDAPVGLCGIPKRGLTDLDGMRDIDAVVIPDRAVYDEYGAVFTEVNPLLKVFWLGDVVTDIYNVAAVCAPLIETLYDIRAAGHDLLFVLAPVAEDVREPSEYESFLIKHKIYNGGIRPVFDSAFPQSGLTRWYTAAEYAKLAASPLSVVPHKNYFVMADYRSERYNIANRLRATAHTGEGYHLHVFGNSAGLGAFLADEHTSSSYLQEKLNKHGIRARVVNHCMDAAPASIVARRIQDTPLGAEDKVVVIMPKSATNAVHADFFADYYRDTLAASDIPVLMARDFFQRPHGMGEVFLDARHLNPGGNDRLAELIFNALCVPAQSTASVPPPCAPYFGISMQMPKTLCPIEEWYDPVTESAEFREYISHLKTVGERYSGKARTAGAIVVNCNPFTYGHRYLIEHSAAEVDFLYVFVVEEDRSVFPFKDRMDLVDKGTADLPNVGVMESGRFMISTLTFPEYFHKGERQGAQIDPSADVELFAQYIAPALGISVRFAGTEPNDSITRQYNETMARILPRYGIEYRELERINANGSPISASRIRDLLKIGNFAEIGTLAPPTTVEYLKRREGINFPAASSGVFTSTREACDSNRPKGRGIYPQ